MVAVGPDSSCCQAINRRALHHAADCVADSQRDSDERKGTVAKINLCGVTCLDRGDVAERVVEDPPGVLQEVEVAGERVHCLSVQEQTVERDFLVFLRRHELADVGVQVGSYVPDG